MHLCDPDGRAFACGEGLGLNLNSGGVIAEAGISDPSQVNCPRCLNAMKTNKVPWMLYYTPLPPPPDIGGMVDRPVAFGPGLAPFGLIVLLTVISAMVMYYLSRK